MDEGKTTTTCLWVQYNFNSNNNQVINNVCMCVLRRPTTNIGNSLS